MTRCHLYTVHVMTLVSLRNIMNGEKFYKIFKRIFFCSSIFFVWCVSSSEIRVLYWTWEWHAHLTIFYIKFVFNAIMKFFLSSVAEIHHIHMLDWQTCTTHAIMHHTVSYYIYAIHSYFFFYLSALCASINPSSNESVAIIQFFSFVFANISLSYYAQIR